MDWAIDMVEVLDMEPADVLAIWYIEDCRDRGFHIPEPATDNGMEYAVSEHAWMHGERVVRVTNRAAFIESVGGPGGDLLRLVYTRNLMEE